METRDVCCSSWYKPINYHLLCKSIKMQSEIEQANSQCKTSHSERRTIPSCGRCRNHGISVTLKGSFLPYSFSIFSTFYIVFLQVNISVY